MFKQATIKKIDAKWTPDFDAMEQAMQADVFSPCGPNQEASDGWSEPRGIAHGALIEAVSGHWVARFTVETKSVPGGYVKMLLGERIAEMEKKGIKPSKSDKTDMKEQIKAELLPHAFPRRSSVYVWIDTNKNFLVIDSTSEKVCDLVTTKLVALGNNFTAAPLNTQASPEARMDLWLSTHQPPGEFSIERECELKNPDGEKSVVRYGRHTLDIEEIKEHIRHGKKPTQLALRWENRVRFTLTKSLQLKKITFEETDASDASGDKDDDFDANMTITTGELTSLISSLVEALDGEQEIRI